MVQRRNSSHKVNRTMSSSLEEVEAGGGGAYTMEKVVQPGRKRKGKEWEVNFKLRKVKE